MKVLAFQAIYEYCLYVIHPCTHMNRCVCQNECALLPSLRKTWFGEEGLESACLSPDLDPATYKLGDPEQGA